MRAGAACFDIPCGAIDEAHCALRLRLTALWITNDVTELHTARMRLEALARTAPLTGLGNRSALNERLSLALQRAQRHQTSFALLYIDLDRFKPINDQHGHEAGDLVLRVVAQRLQSVAREMDAVVRLGGDEFVVLLDDANTLGAAQIAAQRLEAALGEVILLAQGQQVSVGASIGIAHYPEHGDNSAALLQHADQQMYRCKTGAARSAP
jgi:diguanylate cyclase (GGDEF)-like protein